MYTPTKVKVYIIAVLMIIILLLVFIRLPEIVFLDVGDPTMANLIYISLVLSVGKFSLDIINFMLLKLGTYHFLRLEQNNFRDIITRSKDQTKEIKNELSDIKNEYRSLQNRIRQIENSK